MVVRVRLATKDDFLRVGEKVPPAPWFAMVAVDGENLVGFGTITWDEHGHACGYFDRLGNVSAVTIHRTARMVIEWLRGVGEPALYVSCSETIPGAQRWLERLGFQHVANRIWVKWLTT